MYKIEAKMIQDIYNCLKFANMSHRATSFEEKTINKEKIKELIENIESQYKEAICSYRQKK